MTPVYPPNNIRRPRNFGLKLLCNNLQYIKHWAAESLLWNNWANKRFWWHLKIEITFREGASEMFKLSNYNFTHMYNRNSTYIHRRNHCNCNIYLATLSPIFGTNIRVDCRLYLESSVWGSIMFSVIVLFLFHWDSTGLAAARTDVRAFREQMIPALAIDRVCCSCK